MERKVERKFRKECGESLNCCGLKESIKRKENPSENSAIVL